MKKQFIAAALMTAMLAALASCGKSSEAANAEYIYGKIDSISGNDVVLLLAEEKTDKSSDDTEDETEASEKSSSSGKRSGRSKGEMPEGFSKSESGEMPSGFDPKNFSGEMPEGFSRSDKSKKQELGGNSSYSLTGEQEEIRIPVGTDVTTLNGVKTNFDALEEGCIIKCSIEKDSDGKEVVTEVWIVE